MNVNVQFSWKLVVEQCSSAREVFVVTARTQLNSKFMKVRKKMKKKTIEREGDFNIKI